jgi:hypothetical protein
MTEHQKKATLADIPNLGKLEEKGISINAPTPTSFSVPDPWTPAAQSPAGSDSSVAQSDNGASSDPE